MNNNFRFYEKPNNFSFEENCLNRNNCEERIFLAVFISQSINLDKDKNLDNEISSSLANILDKHYICKSQNDCFEVSLSIGIQDKRFSFIPCFEDKYFSLEIKYNKEFIKSADDVTGSLIYFDSKFGCIKILKALPKSTKKDDDIVFKELDNLKGLSEGFIILDVLDENR